MNRLVNFLLFQLCWFACVVGPVHGQPFLGPGFAAVLAAFSIWSAQNRSKEALLLNSTCVLGTLADLIPLHLGAFSFRVPVEVPWGYPLWMSGLWLGFATTFHSSLSWLTRRYVLAALFGFFGGPLAYWAGQTLGAIALGSSVHLSLLAIAVLWALVTPALFYLSAKLQ
jgi:hypothetical protein